MDIVGAIFEGLGTIISQFVTLIVSLFQSVTEIFYVSGAEGGLTVIGSLMLIGVAVGLFWFGFRQLTNWLKMRG